MTYRKLLACAALLAACSSSSTPGPGDGPALDAPRADQGAEARIDSARTDHPAPDGPRPPAQWKTVTGAPRVYLHTATLLKNGDLLIVGGFDEGKTEQSAAYRYLAAQGTFVSAGSLATPRAYHTASLLPDGRVLVAGGHRPNDYLRSTEIYDPASSAWSAGPDVLHKSSEHAAVTLADGKVLLSGGWTSGVDSNGLMQIYDPASGSFTLVTSTLKEARRRHTATLLKNGKVLLVGGVQKTSSNPMNWKHLDSLEVFDPAPATTTLLAAKMNQERRGHTATLLADGRVLIVGGYCGGFDCKPVATLLDDLYDPATDTVTPVPHPGNYPFAPSAALLDDARLLVAGGTFAGASVYAYVSGPPASWGTLPSLSVGRTLASATKLLDGTILLVGGNCTEPPDCNGVDLLDTAERFIP